MTRLFNPAPGELIDRFTILVLKVNNCRKKNLNPYHFEEEAVEITKYITNKFPDLMLEKPSELRKQLHDVNANLWELEDKIRELHKESKKDIMRIVEVSEMIMRLNDQRAGLVRQINEALGIDQFEKLHNLGESATA